MSKRHGHNDLLAGMADRLTQKARRINNHRVNRKTMIEAECWRIYAATISNRRTMTCERQITDRNMVEEIVRSYRSRGWILRADPGPVWQIDRDPSHK